VLGARHGGQLPFAGLSLLLLLGYALAAFLTGFALVAVGRRKEVVGTL
jgi:hypothetical protein